MEKLYTVNKNKQTDKQKAQHIKHTHRNPVSQILKDDAVKVLHSICQQTWKIQQSPQDWKRSVFIPILKKGNAK